MNTLNYSEQINAFQSLIDISPKLYIEFSDKLFSVNNDGSVHRLSKPNSTQYKDMFLRLVVNDDFQNTKVFDNVEMSSTTDNSIRINSAKFYTSNQTSNETLASNIDIRENTHKLSIPRASGDDRMRDKYLICDYEIKGGTDGAAFALPYIKTRYRYSKI